MDKFFPKYTKEHKLVDLSKLQIDDESIFYITKPFESNKIIQFISYHIDNLNDKIIVDLTGGVGGDSINFSKVFKQVISIESDYNRYLQLKNNIEVYNADNIICINGDSTKLVDKIANYDVLYIDPPWGGRNYKKYDKLRLKFGDYDLETFILNCFNKNKSLSEEIKEVKDEKIKITVPKVIVLKLPYNYDITYLNSKLTLYDTYIYNLKNMKIVIIINTNKLL